MLSGNYYIIKEIESYYDEIIMVGLSGGGWQTTMTSSLLPKIKHSYSHFSINLTGYICSYKNGKIQPLASEKIEWIFYQDIQNFAFPKSTIKLFEL